MKSAPLLAMALLATTCFADTVQLTDGSRIEGTIKRESGGWAVTDSAGKVTHVGDDRVQLIEKGSSLTPAQLADQRLTSLRKTLDNLSDITAIIDRLNTFLAQHKGTPAAKEAEKDLAAWKDRQAKKLVKVAGQWVTPEQQAALVGKMVTMVDQARDLLKQGRMRDADAAITKLLAVDPNSPSALYLKGVLANRQDQAAEARKAFDRVRDLLPDHAPTLNNLGVILFKQRQYQGAVALFDMAMVAAPKSRTILDNMAEALNSLSPRDLNSTTVKRAIEHFKDQDKALAADMLKQGLYRWGSSWVNKDQEAELDKARAKIKDKLDALAAEYDKVRSRIDSIDDQIDANNREIERINRDRWVTDARGVSAQLPPPSIYYQLRRDNDSLKSEQSSLIDKLDQYKARARQIQQEMPFPQYTGAVKPIDVEGTPLVLPANAPKAKP